MSKKLKLRQYQKECVDICTYSDGIIILPTGSGKTIIAQEIIHRKIRNHPQLFTIFVPRIILGKQWIKEIAKYLIGEKQHKINFINVNSGCLSNVIKNEIEKVSLQFGPTIPIKTTTNKTEVSNEIDNLFRKQYNIIAVCTYHSNYIIRECGFISRAAFFDECHYMSKELSNFHDAHLIEAEQKYFMTATPRTTNSDCGSGMNNDAVFGNIIFEKKPKEIIKAGAIVAPKLHIVGTYLETNILEGENRNYNALTDIVFSSHNRHKEIMKHNSFDPNKVGAKILVVCNGQATLEGIISSRAFRQYKKDKPNIKVFALCSDYGIYIDGEHDKPPVTNLRKEELINNLYNMSNNDDCIIFHVDMIAEGLDVPGMTGVLFLRNCSKIKALQNLGRCTRPHPEDAQKIENGELKIGKYSQYIKPNCYVILPFGISGDSDDFLERHIELFYALKNDYNFDPSENMVVDILNPHQVSHVFDEVELKKKIRSSVYDDIVKVYHQIEEDNMTADEILFISQFSKLVSESNTNIIQKLVLAREKHDN